MPNNFDDNEELEPLPADIRAAFRNYPRPQASSDFDSTFWHQLDARQTRYRGFVGMCRRLLEVELEGVAVWRLGLSTLGGGGSFALAFALLGAFSTPHISMNSSPLLPPSSPSVPTTSPRYARELWDDTLRPSKRIHKKATRTSPKGGFSCLGLHAGLA